MSGQKASGSSTIRQESAVCYSKNRMPFVRHEPDILEHIATGSGLPALRAAGRTRHCGGEWKDGNGKDKGDAEGRQGKIKERKGRNKKSDEWKSNVWIGMKWFGDKKIPMWQVIWEDTSWRMGIYHIL